MTPRSNPTAHDGVLFCQLKSSRRPIASVRLSGTVFSASRRRPQMSPQKCPPLICAPAQMQSCECKPDTSWATRFPRCHRHVDAKDRHQDPIDDQDAASARSCLEDFQQWEESWQQLWGNQDTQEHNRDKRKWRRARVKTARCAGTSWGRLRRRRLPTINNAVEPKGFNFREFWRLPLRPRLHPPRPRPSLPCAAEICCLCCLCHMFST